MPHTTRQLPCRRVASPLGSAPDGSSSGAPARNRGPVRSPGCVSWSSSRPTRKPRTSSPSSPGRRETRPRCRHPGGRRQQPRRHRRARREGRRRPRPDRTSSTGPPRDGLGAAYRPGFRWGLDDGLRRDRPDGLRLLARPGGDPSAARALIENGADCAIGSRYVPGGSTPDWPLHRRAPVAVREPLHRRAAPPRHPRRHGGFRAYRADVLERIDFDTTRANGYAFQIEVAYRMVAGRLRHGGGPHHVRRPGVRHVEDVGAGS